MEVLVLVALVILGFALYGFISFVLYIFKPSGAKQVVDFIPDKKKELASLKRSLEDDVVASCYLLNHLASKKSIQPNEYKRLRKFLVDKYERRYELPEEVTFGIAAPKPLAAQPTAAQTTAAESSPDTSVSSIKKPVKIGFEQPPQESTHLRASAAKESSTPTQRQQPAAKTIKPAPWDIPDPPAPPKTPRRSMSDILGAFMQEKNIRWGELASGILIVGSAVGLVVSLRDQLQETIPYFPAILFMLITAAIHAAGAYTLKKWKLRKTSRGTLLIGLMLVPLNFLAACILSNSAEPRSLTDPLYITAVISGLSIFSVMTFWSSRLLLRAGNWPITISTMIAAVVTLVANRLPSTENLGLTILYISLPLALSVFVGSCIWSNRFRKKTNWTERTANRMFIMLGLSAFAALVACSLLIIKSADTALTTVYLTPFCTAVSLVTCWVGVRVKQGVSKRNLTSVGIAGQAVSITGLIFAVLAIGYSITFPIMLGINGAIVAAMAWWISRESKSPELIPAVWLGTATAVMTGVCIFGGNLSLDRWHSVLEIATAAISAYGGLSLMGIAIGYLAVHAINKSNSENPKSSKYESSRGKINLYAAYVTAAVGSFLALVAGLLNRDNVLDTTTATVLLCLTAAASLAFAVRKSNVLGPHLAAAATFAALAFTLLWNPITSNYCVSFSDVVPVGLLLTLVLHGALLIGAAVIVSRRAGTSACYANIKLLTFFGATSLLIVSALNFLFSFQQTGIASLSMLISVIGMLGACWANRNTQTKIDWPNILVAFTALLAGLAVVEFGTRFGCPTWNHPQHLLIQICTISGVASLWNVLNLKFRGVAGWLFGGGASRAEQSLLAMASVGLISIVGVGLYQGINQQLVAGYDIQTINQIGFPPTLLGTIVIVFAANLLNYWVRRTKLDAIGLVVLWCVAWAAPAFLFDDSNSAATALRWLMAMGALVTSVIVGSRKFLPRKFGSSRFGLSSLIGHQSQHTQSMINWSLGLPVFGVLAITTATICRVMLTEAQTAALGGPVPGSWFANVSMELSYGVPAILITSALLVFAISEQRRWLAMAGSAIYQYVVLLAIVLLFLSPHPQLASKWFLNILQAISLGMSIFGFVWFAFRDRIDGAGQQDSRKVRLSDLVGFDQLEIHSLINALLVTSLAVLVGVQFYTSPLQGGGWVNSAGGPLGLVALGLVSVLIYLVAVSRIVAGVKQSYVTWLSAWVGLTFVAMLAACLDKYVAEPLIGLRTIALGSVCVLSTVVGTFVVANKNAIETSENAIETSVVRSSLPLWITSIVAGGFLWRAGSVDAANVLAYLGAIAVVVALTTFIGVYRRIRSMQFVSIGLVVASSALVTRVNPNGIFVYGDFDFVNLLVISLCVLSCIWTVAHVRDNQVAGKSHWVFSIFPHVLLFGTSAWVLLGALCKIASYEISIVTDFIGQPLGIVAAVAAIVHAATTFWHNQVRSQILPRFVMAIGISIAVVASISFFLNSDAENYVAWISFAMAATVFAWCIVWHKRERWRGLLTRFSVPNLDRLQRSLSNRLPIYALVVAFFVVVISVLFIGSVAERPYRYFAALTPFVLAAGFGLLGNGNERRWLQITTMLLSTLAMLFVGWADLLPSSATIQWQVRAILVLAGAMFVYGVLVPRWARPGDSWIKTLGEMTVFNCVAALLLLLTLVANELSSFEQNVGCGLGVAESIAVVAVIAGMIAGLLSIAVRPKLDPFAMSVEGRKLYVYAAQAVTVLLGAQLYLTMPWLFQFGLREYWPYIAMLISFAGVGVAHLLQRRGLEVLADPFFKTAVTIPVITSIGIFLVDAPGADSAVVLLIAGLAYLMVSYSQKSILSGAAAVVLGNLALWIFYDRMQGFAFADHPQLWLIPPAVSVLIATQLSREKLTAMQLAAVRYIAVAVIYISSTSEVFIHGIGDQLWPPMVLAALAVVGMMAGIAFEIRAYLYLGSTFLFTAMITMVSHAQQRLDHVWPWWAFGIVLGIAILVMFGLFEKRRNHLRAITGRLKQWEL